MAYTRVPQRRASLLERWARTAYRWRWRVLGAWVLVLAGLTAANFLLGGTFVSEFRVPGAESQHARDLLTERFPARSGDTSDLVFEAPDDEIPRPSSHKNDMRLLLPAHVISSSMSLRFTRMSRGSINVTIIGSRSWGV